MMHIAIVEAFVSDQEHLHQFNWWFDISPQKGYVTARPLNAVLRIFRCTLMILAIDSEALPLLLYTVFCRK